MERRSRRRNFDRKQGYKPALTTTSDFPEEPVDFNGNGLTTESKKYIGKAKYYLGGMTYDEYIKATSTKWYTAERGYGVYSDGPTRPTEWTGYIGLMYPSDYGFSTSGVKETDCQLEPLYNWQEEQTNSQDIGYECRNNSWLYDSRYKQWTISPVVYNSVDLMILRSDGGVSNTSGNTYGIQVSPVLYLKSDILITSGNGLKENPFKLSL